MADALPTRGRAESRKSYISTRRRDESGERGGIGASALPARVSGWRREKQTVGKQVAGGKSSKLWLQSLSEVRPRYRSSSAATKK